MKIYNRNEIVKKYQPEQVEMPDVPKFDENVITELEAEKHKSKVWRNVTIMLTISLICFLGYIVLTLIN